MNIANADNPFTKIMYALGCHILINLYFILCCIPIVTIGASFSAMNAVCYKMKEEPDVHITSTFFKTFVKNLLDGILLWIISAGLMSMLVYVIIFFFKRGGRYDLVPIGIALALAIVVLMEITYVFMLLPKFENDILKQIKNGLLIAVSNLGWTVLIWLVWVIPVGVCALFLDLFRYFGWIWIMCGFSLITSIVVNIYRHIFNKLQSDK